MSLIDISCDICGGSYCGTKTEQSRDNRNGSSLSVTWRETVRDFRDIIYWRHARNARNARSLAALPPSAETRRCHNWQDIETERGRNNNDGRVRVHFMKDLSLLIYYFQYFPK